MKYTHIIWDFNGTLFADMDAGILSVNTMLSERSLPTIESMEQYREVFKFPIIEYYRDLGFDFDAEPYEVLAPIWVELYNENSKRSTLQKDALQALEHFKALGIPQILLSATELSMLKEQIAGLKIGSYFSEVMGLSNIHAYSKKALAIAWKERNPHAVPLFIGDTEHDAEVANAVGADCILVANGHKDEKQLKTLGLPVYPSLEAVISKLK